MKSSFKITIKRHVVSSVFAAAFAFATMPSWAQVATALPTFDPAQGKFVNVMRGFQSLGDTSEVAGAPQQFNISIAVDARSGAPGDLVLEIFDGDMTPGYIPGVATWDDAPDPHDNLFLQLYVDPERIGSTEAGDLIPGAGCPCVVLADNDWTEFINIPQHPDALVCEDGTPNRDAPCTAANPPNAYYYHLVADWETLDYDFERNNFIIRAQAGAAEAVPYLANGSTIGLIGMGPVAPFSVGGNPIHPDTTYDGEFQFSALINEEACVLDIYDGDFDRADDTDDPNTNPNGFTHPIPLPAVGDEPAYTNSQALAADYPFLLSPAAIKEAANAGLPADDSPRDALRISPAVRIYVTGPDGGYTGGDSVGGSVFNENPSGNREWELYRIASLSAACTDTNAANYIDYVTDADVTVDQLLPGFHVITIEGLDQRNTAFLSVDADLFVTRDEECQECEGKVTELSLRYNGPLADIVVHQIKLNHYGSGKGNGKGRKGPTEPLFDEEDIAPGRLIHFVGMDNRGTMGTDITVCANFGGEDECINIHTSCSQPIGPGTQFTFPSGATLTVETAYSRINGLICPAET